MEDEGLMGIMSVSYTHLFEQILVPFIESYDMSGYIVKLDTLLAEMVNKSVLIDNKNLLENFKFMMEEPQETDIKRCV